MAKLSHKLRLLKMRIPLLTPDTTEKIAIDEIKAIRTIWAVVETGMPNI